MADDHRGDRQGGIGLESVHRSFMQGIRGMRAEWFDMPGLTPRPVKTPL